MSRPESSLACVALCVVALAGCCLVSPSVSDTGNVHTGISATSSPVDLDISTRNGNVTVEVDPDSEMIEFHVSLTVGGGTKEEANTRFAAVKSSAKAVLSDDGVASVHVVFPQPKHSNDGADVTVVLPKLKGVNARTSNGDVKVSSANGDITIKTSNGDVVIKDSDGAVTIDTSNGDVDVALVDAATGPVKIDTSNADATLSIGSAFTGVLKMSTSNARITFHDPGKHAKSSSIQRGDGSIDLGEGPESKIDTSNGPITVTIRSE